MKNECMMVGITVAGGAAAVFFAALGYVTRAAYLNGFAEGFTQARDRFERIIRSVRDRKFRTALLDELARSDRERGES